MISFLAALAILSLLVGVKGSAELKCTRSAKLDLQLIVDSSSSVGEKNFQLMMRKIADDIVGQFDIGKDKTRVSLFKYSSIKVMVEEFELDDHLDAASLKKAINAVKYEKGWTSTGMAMNKALTHYSRKMRHDKETAKACIVFTDGKAFDEKQVPAASKAWEKKGVTVFALGIGNGIEAAGLNDITGSKNRFIKVPDFKAIGEKAASLLKKICEQVIKPTKPVHPCDQPTKGGCAQICGKSGPKAVCSCQDGFKLKANKKSCVKVHACDLPTKAGCSQICGKSGAAAVCSCKDGFKLGDDKKSCVKVHPCDLPSKGGCNQICNKIDDVAICSCQNGFKMSGNQKTCSRIGNCKWFCTVTQNRGVIARTTNLGDAQRPLGHGNKNNRQAIIPMTDRNAGDPHTLPKGWGRGSMWWWDWWDINQMRDKCRRQQPVCKVHPCDDHTRGGCNHYCHKNGNGVRCSCLSGYKLAANRKTCTKGPVKPAGPLKWFCAVKINGGVRVKSTDLRAAQAALGGGNQHNRQAVIPMTDRTAGDPHTLSKSWGGGSMWWWGWDDIHNMQRQCAAAGLP